ncbi:MAG: helix-hairpin-helix domain-containing protein, partial [Bacteroidaceae bacterium]|nr:helix-hairpin-helix domain-containing protein [Bacteroidaceae bacterium]
MLLCLSATLHGQETNLLLEEQLEDLASDNETFNWDEIWEDISEPIDLNNATKEQLEKLPFLTDRQIENLLAYLYRHGPMQTIYELQMVEEMDVRTIQLLLPFVEVEAKPQEKHYPRLKNIVKRGSHQVLARLDLPFYQRKGYESAYLGTPQYNSWRYAFSYGDYLQAGFTAEKDAGEPLWKQHNRQGFDHYGFYLTLRNLWKIKVLALGNYRMSFGQ